MYPTKSMLDYLCEINRLFPRYNENDIFSTPNTNRQSFNQSFAQSSSSTDTSPDSLSDMMGHFLPEYNLQSPMKPNQSPGKPDYGARSHPCHDNTNAFLHLHDTPLTARHDRPVIRKIITESVYLDEIPNTWSDGQTPPKAHINQKIEYFELFPSNGSGIQNEFINMNRFGSSSEPIHSNNIPNMAPYNTMSSQAFNMTNVSPRADTESRNSFSEASGMSPSSSMHYPLSSDSSASNSYTPVRVSFRDPIVVPNNPLQRLGSKCCSFCRKNGETPLVYTTHQLREFSGNMMVVTCPILRSHVCSMCGASGDNAHTISYCPVLVNKNNGRPLAPATITLKNTRVKSNGRRRY